MTVERLEREMPADEFDEWIEFYNSEPFGEIRHEYRNALLCSTVANVAGAFGGGEPADMNDYLLFQEKQEEEEVEDWGLKLLKAMGRT
jgi:hypothetical protein